MSYAVCYISFIDYCHVISLVGSERIIIFLFIRNKQNSLRSKKCYAGSKKVQLYEKSQVPCLTTIRKGASECNGGTMALDTELMTLEKKITSHRFPETT